MTTPFTELDTACVKSIRVLSAELPQFANSGHPGAPMGMAAMAHVLFTRHMRFSPKEPQWVNRDRFVLSNGHACALLYNMLNLCGYPQFTLEQLKKFRTVGSITPGHPENHMHKYGHVGGVEVTTGPLGQGVSNAVGIAMAETHMAAIFNTEKYRLFDSYTYVFVGDGCLQEGVAAEACSLAGHLGLGKLIVLYDDNKITIDGDTDVSFTEDVGKRFEAYGFQVLRVDNACDDLAAIDAAIVAAKADTKRPSLIMCRTVIGVDSAVQGTEKAHGSPLGEADIKRLRELYKLPPTPQSAAAGVREFYAERVEKIQEACAEWHELRREYGTEHADLSAKLHARLRGELPDDIDALVPRFKPTDAAAATRKLGGQVLASVIDAVPSLIGGSADLTGSTLTRCPKDVDYQKDSRHGRYVRFGVREHAMAAICNGLAAYHPGAFIPHCATFLNFVQYCLPSVRLSALSHLGVVYVMTHDSIGLGEDGPTHQPIEAAANVRCIPNALFIRPADGNECSGTWLLALKNRSRPTVMALSRQNVPHLANTSIEGVAKGAYVVIQPSAAPQIVLVGTGSELALCVDAAKLLPAQFAVQVVSMPCWSLFDEQPARYRHSVLPPGVPVLSVEALSTFGWSKYAHASIGMTTFGASGPAKDVYKHFNITTEAIVEKATKMQAYFAKHGPAPKLSFADEVDGF